MLKIENLDPPFLNFPIKVILSIINLLDFYFVSNHQLCIRASSQIHTLKTISYAA